MAWANSAGLVIVPRSMSGDARAQVTGGAGRLGRRDMQELPVTWERVVAIWWHILWRWVAGCAVLSLIIGLTAIFIQVQTGTWDPLLIGSCR